MAAEAERVGQHDPGADLTGGVGNAVDAAFGIGIAVVVIGLTRRVRGEVITETGEAQAFGILGVTQPGVLQAEVMAEADAGLEDRSPKA